MKKILSILGLIAILGTTTPAMAAPGGHDGPRGGIGPRPAGIHHVTPAPPHRGPSMRPHANVAFYGNAPRHSYWGGYRAGYWGGYWCDNRLGWCSDYYYPTAPYTPCPPYAPLHGASFSIRF